MLAYAASRPAVVDRRPHPNAMLFIIGAHVAVVAVVMSAKMDLPSRILADPPTVVFFPKPVPPPPPTQQRHTLQTPRQNSRDTVDHPPQQVRTDQGSHDLDTGGVDTGTKQPPIESPPIQYPPIKQIPATSGAQLLTPPSELKPPYPPSKLLNEEEAALQLRLTIDEHGRVIAVDPAAPRGALALQAGAGGRAGGRLVDGDHAPLRARRLSFFAQGWRLPRASPIFPRMSWFPQPSSPRAALRDLFTFMRHSSREQRIAAALALFVTAVIVIMFLVDSKFGAMPAPTETIVELYPSNRTDADIIADQKKDQVAKDAAEKEQRRQFQKLENRLGM